MGYENRLNRDFTNVPVLTLSHHSKYVLFSDCHRGRGDSNDNFLKNQHLYFAALKHYYQKDFTYIELGDGDELWENRCMKQIIEVHSNIFWLLSKFRQNDRLYLLYGNHDMVKKYPRFRQASCSSYFCTATQSYEPLFEEMPFYSGLILQDACHTHDLYLTHGHQADPLNSVFWRLARFLVRYVWRPLEHYGALDPTSAAKNYTVKDKTERRLSHWAQSENKLLITGHTHRPRLSTDTAPYFNTGSCVHPRCITCIEIEHRALTLVKWTLNTRADSSLYVSRQILSGPLGLNQIPIGDGVK